MEPTSPPWLAPEAPDAQPEGMLRISDGPSVQVIWPVYLAGWLALGWQLDWPQPQGSGHVHGQDAIWAHVAPLITAMLGGPSLPGLASPAGTCCRAAT